MSKNKKIKHSQHTVSPRLAQEQTGIPTAVWSALALGAAVKILYLIFSQKSPFYQPLLLDPEYYQHWAERILSGDLVGDKVFYGLPLYPYFLALCYKIFQNSLLAIKIVQALLGLITLFFIYKIGDRIASKKAGIIAIFLAAIYGPLFFHEGILIPETLSLPLYAASFYFALIFSDQPTLKKGVGFGVLCGLAALTKAGLIPFVFIFSAFGIYRQFRDAKKIAWPYLSLVIAFFLSRL